MMLRTLRTLLFTVKCSKVVRDLGVYLYSELQMKHYVNKIASNCYDSRTFRQFATWTFRYHLRWFAGRFATWKFHTFGRFDTKTFRYLSGCFITCPKVCNLRYYKNFFAVRCRNVQGGSETHRWRNVQVAKRPGGSETSRWRTGKVAEPPATIVTTTTTGLDRTYHAHHFIFSFTF